MPVRFDLVGLIQGRLTVIAELPRPSSDRRNERWWLVRCSCGREKAMPSSRLRHCKVQSCGCLMLEGTHKRPTGEAARHSLFVLSRAWAAQRRIRWALNYSDFVRLTSLSCAYCDGPPSMVHGRGRYNGVYVHNGLDRLDSGRGYDAGNVVPACRTCNLAKGTMSVEKFRAWVDRVYLHFVLSESRDATA